MLEKILICFVSFTSNLDFVFYLDLSEGTTKTKIENLLEFHLLIDLLIYQFNGKFRCPRFIGYLSRN